MSSVFFLKFLESIFFRKKRWLCFRHAPCGKSISWAWKRIFITTLYLYMTREYTREVFTECSEYVRFKSQLPQTPLTFSLADIQSQNITRGRSDFGETVRCTNSSNGIRQAVIPMSCCFTSSKNCRVRNSNEGRIGRDVSGTQTSLLLWSWKSFHVLQYGCWTFWS